MIARSYSRLADRDRCHRRASPSVSWQHLRASAGLWFSWLHLLFVERRLCSIDASDVTGCSMCQRLIEPIAVATEQLLDFEDELSPKVGDGGNREGGISWGCLTPPLLHQRSDMPCPTITSSN